ncbi:BZ3500_MvSof-1268-A1-R1_Chr1-2g01347 [Microbotryum saponariae]|uniref:BZ3500_MvSof-1268-A1-R1_Chr1-2g01347 protein n=1 Tax=Microbotryum saponariae TaxID=289078 RepID=A0A2X0L6F7_9BASI|nr:BZ3500_MvSof-1268-A1-R1_Chr1-2g01347 [Microbotryum saponariae]SCZ97166.1 BZ3501_MvSof-1269-A2-R1_Chr1-2g00946 [Microbotryum saponariae]
MNARQARDWQDVKSHHISAQSDRAMSHCLATITSPLAHDVQARLLQVDKRRVSSRSGAQLSKEGVTPGTPQRRGRNRERSDQASAGLATGSSRN